MVKLAFYFTYAWRSVKRGGRLSLFAMLCVAVGVATLVALQSLTISLRDTLTGNVQERAGGDLVASVNFNTSYQSTLSPQAQQLLDRFKAQGQLTDWTGLNTHSMQITGYFNVPPTVYIIDPAHFPLYGKLDLLQPAGANFGPLLAEPNTIIISKSLWKTQNYRLGDLIEVSGLQDFTQAGEQAASLKIVGVLDPVIPGVNFDTGLFIGFGIVSQQTARAFLKPAEVTPTTFFLKTNPASNPQVIVDELLAFNQRAASTFPFFSQIRPASEVLGESNRNLQTAQDVLLYIGLVGLVIGGLGCVNTMLVVVGQRTAEIATVKALGLNSYQTLLIFTLHAIIIGGLGSTLGVGLGVGLGFAMRGVVESLFARTLEWGLYPGPLLTGLLVGTLASAIFGFLPAYAASRVRPVVVLRHSVGLLPPLGLASTLIIGLIITTCLGLLTGALLGQLLEGLWLAFLTLGVSLVLISVMYGAVFLISRLPPLFGLSFKLALRNFNRQRTRAASTLLVVTLSLFFISFIGIVSESVKITLKQAFDFNLGFNAGAVNVYSQQDQQLQATFEREIEGLQKIFISNGVGASLSGLNGKAFDSEAARQNPACGAFLTEGRNGVLRLNPFIQLNGRSLSNGESISPNGPQKVLAGRTFTPADVDKRVLLVTQEEASCYGINLGDTVTMRLRSNNLGSAGTTTPRLNGPVELEVIGIVSKGTTGTLFERGWVAPFSLVNQAGAQFSIFFMQINPPQVKAALTKVQSYLYSNFVFDLSDLIATFSNLLNGILALPLLLSLLTLFSGAVLIANNVALAVLERRHEIGVLKAIGAKRRRVLAILLWENVLLGLLGGLIGVGGSLLAAALLPELVRNTNRNLNLLVAWSPLNTLLVLGLGVVIGVFATVVSAWQAVQEKPLVVLRYE